MKQPAFQAEVYGRLTPGRRIGTHTFRHSYARRLLMHGIPINRLSRWLAHASITPSLVFPELVPYLNGRLAAVPCSCGAIVTWTE